MKKYPLLALAGALLIATAASAQTKKAAAKAATTPAAPGVCAVLMTASQPAAQPAATPARLAPPVRGDAKVNITKPSVKREGEFVVTTLKVKNVMDGSIAGLKIDDSWYDKKGDPVTGSQCRYTKPLRPGEVLEITLKTPANKQMDRNQYLFSQANGAIKPTTVPKL